VQRSRGWVHLDYGTSSRSRCPIIAMNEAPGYPRSSATSIAASHALCEGLARLGWEFDKPQGTMFVWSRIPEPYEELGSIDFATQLVRDAKVAVSPGVGFGPGGEGSVRFALVENEQRIKQAVRGIGGASSWAEGGRWAGPRHRKQRSSLNPDALLGRQGGDDVVAAPSTG
jgi:hypothetical protein